MHPGRLLVLHLAVSLIVSASAPLVLAASPGESDRMRVAVLEFEPATPEARASGKGRLVSEMLTTAAVNSRWFAVVERRLVSRLLEEMEFGERGLSYTSAALKVGALTGATAVLSGSVAESGGRTRIDARFIDVESGRILWAKVVTSGSGLDSIASSSQRLVRELDAFAARHLRETARAAMPPPATDAAPPGGPREIAPGPPAPAGPSEPGAPATSAGEADAAPAQPTIAPASVQDDPGGDETPAPARPATAVDPQAAEKAQTHYRKAREHGRAKRYAKAVREMDKALALDPSRAEYHAARGHARYFTGNAALALEDYDQALALDGSRAAVHSMRGLCLAALGRDEEAAAAYDRAVELDPDNAELFLRRGRLMQAMGRADRMCADFAAACGLGKCECAERAQKEGLCPAAP